MKTNEIIKIENYTRNKIDFIEWQLQSLQRAIKQQENAEILERHIFSILVEISRIEGVIECFKTKLKYAPSQEWLSVWNYAAPRYSKVKSIFKEIASTWAGCPERLKYLINRNL